MVIPFLVNFLMSVLICMLLSTIKVPKVGKREKTREFEKHYDFLLASLNNKIHTKFTVM